MPKRPLNDLQTTLLDMFANSVLCDPQDDDHFWAINESIDRIDPWSVEWRFIESRKAHECVRGCSIKEGDVYVQREITPWNKWKFCVSCAAMIFYFMKVYKLRPVSATHWDLQAKASVLIEPGAKPGEAHETKIYEFPGRGDD